MQAVVRRRRTPDFSCVFVASLCGVLGVVSALVRGTCNQRCLLCPGAAHREMISLREAVIRLDHRADALPP